MLSTDDLVQVLDRVRTSLWFIPGMMTLGAMALAWAVPRLDQLVDVESIQHLPLIFTGRAEGARVVLSTVAGSTITIAGVVFSMTLVSLQLASSQFGPRLLRTFLRDRGNQIVLGTFVATFLYSILILPSVDAAEREADRFVPHLAVSLSVVLSLASLGMLVYYIHHVAQSIQADSVIAAVSVELLESIERQFPEKGASPPEVPGAVVASTTARSGAKQFRVLAAHEGYLRFVNIEDLMALAKEHRLTIQVEVSPGSFILLDRCLASVWARGETPDRLDEKIEDAFVTGRHRTTLQDVTFVFEQLVEMGERALSPSINDPTTAAHCIDRIGSGLARIAARGIPEEVYWDEEHTVCVVMHHVPFQELLDRTVRPLRSNAAGHLQVWLRLIQTLAAVHRRAMREEDRRELISQARRVHEQALRHIEPEDDRADLAAAMKGFGQSGIAGGE